MKTTMMIVICMATVACLIASCAPTRVEMDYGTSHQLQKYNQILNPEAEKNMDPVVGLSAQAAQNAVDKYQKGFEPGAKTSTTYQINVGDIEEQ